LVRRLLNYLPHVIRNVREYKAIMDDGDQEEISKLWEAVDNAFDDQFVNSATIYGVQRWEKLLHILPKGTDSLDARKFRILARLNEQLPYTLRVLENMLFALCGEDGYTVEVQNDMYTLNVKIALKAKSNVDDVDVLLKKVVPANMIIELSLMYNQYYKLKPFRHIDLKPRTHYELRNEVL